MIARIIEFSVRNRWLVLIVWLGVAIWGVWAVLHTPVDAIPDLSENQVIVFADWMGRTPQDIEEQVTYPLSVQFQGLAGVKTVRSSSEPNFSMINIIFDDRTDPYFARTRVLERLSTARASLPPDVTPTMAPDATALGQIFWYTVECGGKSIDELRAIQDFYVRYQLNSIPGVAEVASVGGFVREYQVDVDPGKLRVYDLPLSAVYSAISLSNMSVGGKAIVTPTSEYLIRSVGWLRDVHDLENVVVISRAGVPIRVKDVATVQLGPEFRRSALEKDGEAVGGVVMMRIGENPLAVTQAIKQRIADMQSGLPPGVRVVPFYDRTRLIESAIHTVTATLREEIMIASIAILLILTHLRSAIVVCATLPMAVLISFLFMYYAGIPSNIMSLSGIAISIGILVDAAVVMVENASHELKAQFGDEHVRGDTTAIVIRACRLVGRPIFFSVLIMLISFLPVFAFGGQEGKLSHPLAFTKSFAMVGVAILAITFVPAVIPLMIKGRLRGEEQNWIVRSFIHMYKPVITFVIERPGIVWWMMAVIISLGAGFIETKLVSSLAIGLGIIFVLLGVHGGVTKGAAVTSLLLIAFLADTRFPKLGGEFMPELNEGAIMDMPVTAPRVPMAQAVDDVRIRDRLLRSFPEVEQAVGKIGRAETATDPSPVDMVETIVSMQPQELWPKRKIDFSDALNLAADAAPQMQRHGWLKSDAPGTESWADVVRAIRDDQFAKRNPKLNAAAQVLNTATQIAVSNFDRGMRNLARRRQIEYEPLVLAQPEEHREELWRQRTKALDWELFDYGKIAIQDELLDALYRTALGTPFAGIEPVPSELHHVRDGLVRSHEKGLFFWQKTKDDIVKEMDSELQMPGWSNIWTQPIINRVNMLATGVRTQIGVKVFGPTGKSLGDAIDAIQRVSEEIAARVRKIDGAADVTADQSTGKRYVEVVIDRARAARYGVNVADISQAVEIAMGGGRVTTTVEGRQRFPVRLRYARQYWQDIDSLKDILVTASTTPVALRGPQAQDSTSGAAPQVMQIPLRMVADIRVVDGPSMIKSENGRLRNYVTLNVRGRDVMGFVEEARQAIQPIEAKLAGTGMNVEWSGDFENQVRTNRTLAMIFPMVLVLIVLLLYLTFHSMLDTLLVLLAVLGALAGAVMFQALFGFNFSVMVWIGYIAAFGMATETGVIMLVYLREAIDKRGGLEGISSLEELRQAVIEGAVHRLRPKLLTEGVAIVGLVPMLWAAGTGAEIMRPMAAPVLGGLLISDEVIDLMIPVLFYWIRRARWQKLHGPAEQDKEPNPETLVTA